MSAFMLLLTPYAEAAENRVGTILVLEVAA
jgi:hypothetical protein